MKKFSLMLTLAIMMVGSTVFAGSIDYLGNQSAKYLMTFTRNASTDASADIVNYNPAGTAFLAEGFYVDISNQTLIKPYSTDTICSVTTLAKTSGQVADINATQKQSEPTYLLPNVYAAYNFGMIGAGKLAAYAQVGITAGGGSLKWNDGTPGTTLALTGISAKTSIFTGGVKASKKITSQSIEVSSVYYGGALGASYSLLDDMISLSLGGRYLMAQKSLQIQAAFTAGTSLDGKYSFDANGYTPIVGFDIKPMKELTLAVRYEGETKLEFKYKQDKFDTLGGNADQKATLTSYTISVLAQSGIADGIKFNYNLPQVLALGAEYAVTKELSVMTSANIYFLHQADLGKVFDSSMTVQSAENIAGDIKDYYGTGYEVSLGATYLVMPELKIGAGFIYTDSGAKKSIFNNQFTILTTSANPPLNAWTISLGATYTVIPDLDVTLSGSWTHYIPVDYKIVPTGAAANLVSSITGTYKKDVYNIGVGVGYKI